MKHPLVVSGLALLLFALFVSFQAWGIYTGDSGDLVTAGYLFGVPHPPGYPLYTFLMWLVTRVPIATVAFRATLLSSLFHAAAATAAFLLVATITKKWWAGLFAALFLAGNYVFFLYSVTPEVFALFDFFVILLVFLVWRFIARPSLSLLSALIFVLGLSLTHHHLIVFFFPALFWVLWSKKNALRALKSTRPRTLLRLAATFILGLAPYLYVPIAAQTSAIINWNRAEDLEGFIRLVTRADYGTFRSGAIVGHALAERLVQVSAYARFVLLDFGWIGVGLALGGAVFLIKKQRLFAQFVLISLLFVGPVYFFYASFPLVNRFMLGTYERFLLPSYVLLALLAGCGVVWAVSFVLQLPFFKKGLSSLLSTGVACILFLSPLLLLGVTLSRFWGLPQDQTAARLAQDVLASIPEGDKTLLLLTRDTTLFTTQYMRYVERTRPDVPIVAFNNLGDPRYRVLVSENFSDIIMPESSEEGFLSAFLSRNAGAGTKIFTNSEIPLAPGFVLVAHGLLYEVVSQEDVPDKQELRAANEALFARYQQVEDGILGRFNHLMLSDVRDVYAGAHIAVGKAYVRADEVAWARDEFAKAIALKGDNTILDAYTYLGLSELWLGNCEPALVAFARARQEQFVASPALTLYESVTYKDCAGDPARASELFEQYEKERQSEETLLETL
jgi:hypothetical protein